jgi:hypothetical protein
MAHDSKPLDAGLARGNSRNPLPGVARLFERDNVSICTRCKVILEPGRNDMRERDNNGNSEHLNHDLDEDFPLGDGTADLAAVIACPYCGESVEITLDPGSGAVQDYVEDCEVCCQPWRVVVRYDDEGQADVSVTPLGE